MSGAIRTDDRVDTAGRFFGNIQTGLRPPSRRFSLGMAAPQPGRGDVSKFWARSEEHTSELQSLMRISYAVFCLKKKKKKHKQHNERHSRSKGLKRYHHRVYEQ